MSSGSRVTAHHPQGPVDVDLNNPNSDTDTAEVDESEENTSDNQEEDDDGADDDEIEDDEGEETDQGLENPSTDIRKDLEDALYLSNDSFPGSYYFKKQYSISEAPNPLLNISVGDLGVIGLPLNVHGAKQIISHSHQAPFGMGERTVVDREVRDTWEMDASVVRFDNPAWSQFIKDVVKQICTALGVDVATSKPRAELYKMLLYETGSHFLPHKDTEKVDGMFATMMIILPSPFTGGSAHLSHAGRATVIDFSGNSLSSTSVMAWYTDVTHEIKPITSGYRLALSYNLVHTTDALRPSLHAADEALARLRHIFLSWKQVSSAPEKILYLLDHKYSKASLRGSAMKGTDAHLASLLDSIARELGFEVGLALVECHVSGVPESDYGRSYRRGYLDDDDEEEDVDDLMMDEVLEQEMSITNLVKLNGQLITASLDADEDGEFIPEELRETVEEGTPDKQDYEGYQGNWGPTLDRWYRRTVLVIWPRGQRGALVYGHGYPQHVLDKLRATNSRTSNKEERKLITYALRHAARKPTAEAEVVRCVCGVACRWGDIALWYRAMDACHGSSSVDKLTSEGIFKAILALGMQIVFPKIHEMMCNDTSNARRLRLIEQMESNAQIRLSADQALGLREAVMKNLRPLAAGEGQLLLDTASKQGGLHLLENTEFARKTSNASSKELLSLIKLLRDKQSDLFANPSDEEVGKRITAKLLSHAIDQANYFEGVKRPATTNTAATRFAPYYRRPAPAPPPVPTPDLALSHIQACFEIGNEHLVQRVTDKLMVAPGASDKVQEGRESVLLAVASHLVKQAEARPVAIPGLDAFCRAVMPSLLGRMHRNTLTEADVSTVLHVAIIGGEAEMLENAILPKFKSLARDTTACRVIIHQLRARENQLSPLAANSSISAIITDLLKSTIQRLSPFKKASALVDMLELCYETGNRPCFVDVLSPLLNNEPLTAELLESFILAFLPAIAKFLSAHQVDPTADPFASFYKQVVTTWTRGVLGSKPAAMSSYMNSIRTIPSHCDLCKSVIRFLTLSTDKSLYLDRIGAPGAKHLEQQLNKSTVHTMATWKTIMSTPRGFHVVKNNTAFVGLLWLARQQQGLRALKSISAGDDSTLAIIFGDGGFGKILQQLDVPSINPPKKGPGVETVHGAGSTQPSASASTSAIPAPQHLTHPQPSTSAGPSPKRMKMAGGEPEVIDLT
ncbi:hypothetical protein BOTBODRAFT_57070 [Botryobasidium botryosum FD-172 SS1]|uniref:Prolyl 4-hydroxylase alpha subunit Fe(2+) 2OG dioxygenase domain-containing protein n=1 Tax=Botryobasidium botryosum (strain FD-172 SS1) TaxID=930990 RepID=A0A067MBD1_BOTB1|nr:hypothetical protein BOTBODRAFT_57070 [Botryobasidium botryosum FD-172 SS1]